MAMTEGEINRLIDKLKKRYAEYSRKNPTWFNMDAFNDRLLMAYRNRMNLEAFILAEIANFEKVRDKYEKKKNEKSFSDQVDRIIDEITARIKKYPAIRFHPKAGVEITHFYGALSDFELNYFPVLFIIAEDKSLKDRLIAFEQELNNLAAPRGKLPAKRVEDHLMKLRLRDAQELEIERDKNEYLKESAFLLHDIIDFCDGLIESRNQEWENPLRMNRLYVEDKRKKAITTLFAGLTGYGAIMMVRDRASEIIDDFRLTAFRRQK
ncbi:MAG TPA: hypothetical protein PLM53_17910 [Spirochaetota bacterium]|nr:hypothetical protein [Spirochaetota bacterium]HPC42714.1 hypothetical protein [Spirochaetota bacterium]HPL16379.1 hypothetical protein [Spirochaetota bacterium]HQF08338.1 hypothetical protein [Spirochaetota bacterium]HQH98975.1 hypothetical protein [Spirochaetota bacterium]